MKSSLYLHEEFMLLCLREEAGTVVSKDTIAYSLAAAILSELLLQKRIELDQVKKKKQLVNVVDSQPLGEALLDEALEMIKNAKRRKSLKNWVRQLAKLKKLWHRTALQLCHRGILRADEDKVLLLFTRKIYPELDPAPERKLVERISRAVFSDNDIIPPRVAIIIALSHQANILKNKFDKKSLKLKSKRIKEITKGSHTAKALKEVTDALDAAVFIAVFMN